MIFKVNPIDETGWIRSNCSLIARVISSICTQDFLILDNIVMFTHTSPAKQSTQIDVNS